jgi:V8-like Glu-specific endopeptidase
MAESFLDRKERTNLVRVVAGLYDFTDQGPRGRRVFLQETAGLGRFIPGMDLTGNARTVAADLVGRLERFGDLPERPAYHALGALATSLLGLEELSEEDATFVAKLVVRYSLVADESYLKQLRERYGIAERAVREAPTAAARPRRGAPEAPTSPAFEPLIKDQAGLEAIINSEDNFLDVYLLQGATYCAQAVGRVEVPEGKAQGTGFLVGPDLLLTNQHVLKDEAYLEEAVVRFAYMNDASGVAATGKVFRLQAGFYFASPAEQLDYALVRLLEKPLAGITAEADLASAPIEALLMAGKHRGYLILAPRMLLAHARVNILQHPGGDPLKVVLTQNYVVHTTQKRVQYVADTMEGSSGSPVFNHNWEVVALHHTGSPYPPDALADLAKKAWKGRFRVNEGIPIRAILEDFRAKGIDRHLPRA